MWVCTRRSTSFWPSLFLLFEWIQPSIDQLCSHADAEEDSSTTLRVGHIRAGQGLKNVLIQTYMSDFMQSVWMWHTVTGGTTGAHIIRQTGLSVCVWGWTFHTDTLCHNKHTQGKLMRKTLISHLRLYTSYLTRLSSSSCRSNTTHLYLCQFLTRKREFFYCLLLNR